MLRDDRLFESTCRSAERICRFLFLTAAASNMVCSDLLYSGNELKTTATNVDSQAELVKLSAEHGSTLKRMEVDNLAAAVMKTMTTAKRAPFLTLQLQTCDSPHWSAWSSVQIVRSLCSQRRSSLH